MTLSHVSYLLFITLRVKYKRKRVKINSRKKKKKKKKEIFTFDWGNYSNNDMNFNHYHLSINMRIILIIMRLYFFLKQSTINNQKNRKLFLFPSSIINFHPKSHLFMTLNSVSFNVLHGLIIIIIIYPESLSTISSWYMVQ